MLANAPTIYHRDGREETVEATAAAWRIRQDPAWSYHKPPPPGWEREIPKYRVTRDVEPVQKERFRSEPPFTYDYSTDVWQYGERSYKCGEVIDTKNWPHSSFQPLNYSAAQVLHFFNSRQKSRMTNSPWHVNQLRLDDGMGGGPVPEALLSSKPPPRDVEARPASKPPAPRSMRRVVEV